MIPFIEDKPIDAALVAEFLDASRAANRWTNFGPTCHRLEAEIGERLELPALRSVVFCSSATTALFALVGLEETRHRRLHGPRAPRLRWVTSAFTFGAARVGPLADARVLDCDAQGFLDFAALAALPPESYDAVLVTNPFGLQPDWSGAIEFCRVRGKKLVYDNAMALLGPDRTHPHAPPEAISFHHTKPWGFGEGGCAIVATADEPTLRALINHGAGLEPLAHPWACNGKLSDPACALILQRLRHASDWEPAYREQAGRIVAALPHTGLRPFATLEGRCVPGQVPLLGAHPIPPAALVNPRLALEKYYEPLAPDCAVAADLYARIVNVPCHSGVARLPDPALAELLRRLGQAGSTSGT